MSSTIRSGSSIRSAWESQRCSSRQAWFGEVPQRVDVADDQVPHAASPVARRDRRRLDEVRGVGRCLFLVEALALDPVGEAVQHQRPPGQVRQHHVGDGLVVLGEVGLRVAGVGVEHLVRPGDRPGGSSSRRLLTYDVGSGLVVAQPEVARVAQPAVAGPLGEPDLRHQFGAHPVGAPLAHPVHEGRRRRLRARRTAPAGPPARGGRTRCRPCPRSGARPSTVVVADEQGAEAGARALPGRCTRRPLAPALGRI